MKTVFILAVSVMAYGCNRHLANDRKGDRVTVCGMLRSKDGKVISGALLHLYNSPKDTVDNVAANSYELTGTDTNGHFVLRSTYADRQYWLAIERSSGCERLTISELESRRVPVTFHHSAGEGECESTVNAVLDDGCNLKFQ